MKNKKIRYALKSMSVGLVAGITVQYLIEFVMDLIKKMDIKEALKVNSNWQLYYSAGIAGGINGFLLPFIPANLSVFSSILIIVAVYNSIMIFSDYDTFVDNIKNSNNFTFGIVRDIFLIVFIVYIIKLIGKYTNNKNKQDKEERSFNELLEITIISSFILSISFSLSQSSLNKLFEFNNSSDIAITEE